jgi:hypothetical protein
MLIPIKVNDPSTIKYLGIGDLVYLRYINNNLVAISEDRTQIGNVVSKSICQIEDKCKQQETVSYLIWAIFKKSIIIELNGYMSTRIVS